MCREPVGEGAKRVTTAGVGSGLEAGGEVMAGVITPAPANPSLAEWTRRFLGAQVADQTLRWRLWAPVAFGGGCGTYFALKTEPPVWPLVAGAFLAVGLWFAARRLALPRLAALPLMLLACFALGIMVAKLRTDAVAAPIAPAMAEPTVIEGWVIDVDSRGSAGPRVVIDPRTAARRDACPPARDAAGCHARAGTGGAAVRHSQSAAGSRQSRGL